MGKGKKEAELQLTMARK